MKISIHPSRSAFASILSAAALALPLALASPATRAEAGPSDAAVTRIGTLVIHQGPSEAVLAWRRAVEAGDIEAIAAMYGGVPAVAYPVGRMSARGGESIATDYRQMFDRYRAKVEIHDAAWVRQGRLLNSWGLFSLTLTPRAGGEPVRVDGRFSDLAVRRGDGWRYLVDHASVPAP